MSENYYSNQFVRLLEKRPKSYTLKNKLEIMDSLQAVFNCHEVLEYVSKSDLITICDMLARIAFVEMDKPNSLETVEYERANMIAIASFLKIIDSDKRESLLS